MPECTHHRSLAGQHGRPPVYHTRALLPLESWTCGYCRRHLATIDGPIFVTPRGIRGHLPASIRCPRCKTRNVRAGQTIGATTV
jgi:hypothetical protein